MPPKITPDDTLRRVALLEDKLQDEKLTKQRAVAELKADLSKFFDKEYERRNGALATQIKEDMETALETVKKVITNLSEQSALSSEKLRNVIDVTNSSAIWVKTVAEFGGDTAKGTVHWKETAAAKRALLHARIEEVDGETKRSVGNIMESISHLRKYTDQRFESITNETASVPDEIAALNAKLDAVKKIVVVIGGAFDMLKNGASKGTIDAYLTKSEGQNLDAARLLPSAGRAPAPAPASASVASAAASFKSAAATTASAVTPVPRSVPATSSSSLASASPTKPTMVAYIPKDQFPGGDKTRQRFAKWLTKALGQYINVQETENASRFDDANTWTVYTMKSTVTYNPGAFGATEHGDRVLFFVTDIPSVSEYEYSGYAKRATATLGEITRPGPFDFFIIPYFNGPDEDAEDKENLRCIGRFVYKLRNMTT